MTIILSGVTGSIRGIKQKIALTRARLGVPVVGGALAATKY
jgi:hypothetical protein